MTLTLVGEPTPENMTFRDDATDLEFELAGAELTASGVRGTVTVMHKGTRVGRDRLLLSSLDKRKRLAKSVAGFTALEAGPVEVALLDLDNAAAEWLASASPTTRQLEAPLTEEEEREALAHLAALLDGVRAFVCRYVIMSEAQADAVALWTAHTYALDAAETTPYLSITSAEKRSGKSRLLEAASLLVARPWLTGRVTAAVLVRKTAKDTPTLLLDESDAAFKGEKEYAETLRAVLNAGYRRGGVASMCVKVGGDFDLRDFPVFGPKAIAGIGKLPDTIADRAIPIALKRKAPTERTERFRWRYAQEEAAPLREGLEAWASAGALQDTEPEFPDGLDDRALDGWEPLMVIADAAGGEWPARARNAALTLSVGDSREDDSLGVRLLRDIRNVFDERAEDRITCAELVRALVAMEEAPWGDLRGKALDTRRLGWRLRPYEIRSRTIRLDDGSTARGYLVDMFVDGWTRYLPPVFLEQPTQPTQTDTRPDTDTANVSVVTSVSVSPGVHVRGGDRCTHVLSLAETQGWPHVSLGEREVNGRKVNMGVPGGRFAWEQAVKFWPDELLGELLPSLEEMAAGGMLSLAPEKPPHASTPAGIAVSAPDSESGGESGGELAGNGDENSTPIPWRGQRGESGGESNPLSSQIGGGERGVEIGGTENETPDFDRAGAIAYIMSAAEMMEFPLDSGHRIGPGKQGYERRLKGMRDDELRELVNALGERLSE